MNSEYFKVGAIVNIKTPKSHLAHGKVSILEVHLQGIVGTQKGIKNAPVNFFSWDKIEEMELLREDAVIGTRTTSGKRS